MSDEHPGKSGESIQQRREGLTKVAQHAIDSGFLVFPIEPNAKNKFFSKKWQDYATPNPDIVQGWFDLYGPNINLGIVPHHGFVIDWDDEDFGKLLIGIAAQCTPDAAAEITKALYSTYRVKTPRGGYHAYFRMPKGSENYPRQYTHNHPHLKELDTRVDNKGYVVSAGSEINRKAYSRVSNSDSVLEAPPALLEFLRLQSVGKGGKAQKPAVGTGVDDAGSVPAREDEKSVKYIPINIGHLQTAIDHLKQSQPGSRNLTLFQVACKLFDKKYHLKEVSEPLLKAAREHGLTAREAQITINSAWTKVTRKLLQFPQNCIISDIKSNALYAFEELLEFLALDFRFNVRSQVIEYCKVNPKAKSLSWDAWDDELTQYYLSVIAQKCVRRVFSKELGELFVPCEISQYRFSAWLQAYSRLNEVDPFLDYILKCEQTVRLRGRANFSLHSWINTCFSHEYTELDKWIAEAIICAAVQRAMQPGSKWDIMPVLYGTGGAGKSTMLKYLFPAEYRHEWSTDTVDFSMSNKDLVGIMIPTVFAEAQELKGLSQADRRHEKQVLSTHVDRVRLPYAKRAGLYPRRSIIIGTTDDVDSLPRDSNMRRYAVTSKLSGKLSLTEILEYMNENRDKIWAAGVKRVKSGDWTGFMPEELYTEQSDRNTYMQVSEDAIESRLARVPASQDKGVKFVTLKLYANMASGDRELYNDYRIREYLKVAKWVKKRVRPLQGEENRDVMVTWYFPPAKENNTRPVPCAKKWDCVLATAHAGECMDEDDYANSLSFSM